LEIKLTLVYTDSSIDIG